MEIEEEEQGGSMTEEMASFYSSLEPLEEAPPPAEVEGSCSPALAPVHSSTPAPSTDSPHTSAPSSPAQEVKAKKRKKVKVSNNIALKKKGVGDMLAKWQKINS